MVHYHLQNAICHTVYAVIVTLIDRSTSEHIWDNVEYDDMFLIYSHLNNELIEHVTSQVS
jgi:hypothetical protein